MIKQQGKRLLCKHDSTLRLLNIVQHGQSYRKKEMVA